MASVEFDGWAGTMLSMPGATIHSDAEFMLRGNKGTMLFVDLQHRFAGAHSKTAGIVCDIIKRALAAGA
jgi:hypothetical protein